MFKRRNAMSVVAEENQKLKSFDEMPAVPKFPIIGVMWSYLPFIGKYNVFRQDEADMAKYKEYGKILREDISKSFRLVQIYGVEDIEKLARHEGKVPFREPLLSVQLYRESNPELYTNIGLLANNGDEWYNMRSKAQPHLLKPKAIHSYLPQLDGAALELVEKINLVKDSQNEVADLLPELYKWALESISLIVLETKLNCLNVDLPSGSDSTRMIDAVNNIFRVWIKLEFSAFKLWRFLPLPSHRVFVQNMDIFSSISRKYIHEAKARMDADQNSDREATLLETLFYKEKMDERDATTMITDLLLGGIDTTSHSVAFTLYQLAKHEDAQEKAYQEVCRVLPDKNVPIKPEHFTEIRYLKASVKEAMRLNPIVQATSRKLTEDIELSGYNIPAGVLLVSNIGVPSRLEENFKNATKYQPERWLRGDNVDKINPFASLPFSRGARSCIGKRIAEQEMWTLLIRILQNYKVEYHHEDIGVITGIVSRPDKPLRFKFIRR